MNLKAWWRGFKARHLVADDPWDWSPAEGDHPVRPADVLAPAAPVLRIIPFPCRRPNGAYTMGWRVSGSCDAEIVEVIWCAWVLGQRKGVSA